MSIRGKLGPRSLTVVVALGVLALVAINLPLEASGETGEQSPPIVYVSTAGGGISEINTANASVIATLSRQRQRGGYYSRWPSHVRCGPGRT